MKGFKPVATAGKFTRLRPDLFPLKEGFRFSKSMLGCPTRIQDGGNRAGTIKQAL